LAYAPLNVEPAQPSDAATGAACAVSRPGPGPERYIKGIVAGAGDVISIARGFVVATGSPKPQITLRPVTGASIKTSPRRS
jgi:hypothetical protein